MEKIRLKQLMRYFDQEDEGVMDRIQIVTEEQEWRYAGELYVNSDLITLAGSWFVEWMRIEHAFDTQTPIIRVFISPS